MDDAAAMVAGIVILTMGLVITALLTFAMVQGIRSGSLKRNDVMGIRTKATKASDRAWEAGHQAAVPLLVVSTAIGGVVAGLAVVFLLITLMSGAGVGMVLYGFVCLGYVVQTALLIWGCVKGNRAAKFV